MRPLGRRQREAAALKTQASVSAHHGATGFVEAESGEEKLERKLEKEPRLADQARTRH